MKLVVLLCLMTVACAVGCSRPDPPANSKQLWSEKADLSKLVTVAEIRPQLNDGDRPNTAEELKTRFGSLLETEPEKAFIDFVDWTVVPHEKQLDVLGGLMTFPFSVDGTKKHTLRELRLRTVEDYCRELGRTIDDYNEDRPTKVSHVLELHYEFAENVPFHGALDIGTRDGKYFLYPDNF